MNTASARRVSMSASVGRSVRPTRGIVFDAVTKRYPPAAPSMPESQDSSMVIEQRPPPVERHVQLSDEQTMLATAAYDAHGGVAAHIDLMLQRLSLFPAVRGPELLAKYNVRDFVIPLASFLAIVRDVYAETVTSEALEVFASSVGLGPAAQKDLRVLRAHRFAERDAQIAFEALHSHDNDSPNESLVFSCSAGNLAIDLRGDRSRSRVTTPATTRLRASGDDDVLRQIIDPVRAQPFDVFRETVITRDEDPQFVRAFRRLGAERTDLGYVLDTKDLVGRCEALGMSNDEQQAVINLLDGDCSGDVDFEEFKTIMTGDLGRYGLNDTVVAALQKLLGQPQTARRQSRTNGVESKPGAAGGTTPRGNDDTKRLRRTQSLFARLGLPGQSRTRAQIASDEEDEVEDAAARERRMLEEMRATVDSCREHQQEQRAAIGTPASPRRSSPPRAQAKASAAVSLPPVQGAAKSPRGARVSYAERRKLRKFDFNMDAHRRMAAAKTMSESVVKRVINDESNRSEVAKAAIAAHHPGPSGMLPTAVLAASSDTVTTSSAEPSPRATAAPRHSRPSRLVPMPPKDGSAPNTARPTLGSRGELYDRILHGTDDAGVLPRHRRAAAGRKAMTARGGARSLVEVTTMLAPKAASARFTEQQNLDAVTAADDQRLRSLPEVRRIVDENASREVRLAEHARNRAAMFQHQAEVAQALYQVGAHKILARASQRVAATPLRSPRTRTPQRVSPQPERQDNDVAAPSADTEPAAA